MPHKKGGAKSPTADSSGGNVGGPSARRKLQASATEPNLLSATASGDINPASSPFVVAPSSHVPPKYDPAKEHPLFATKSGGLLDQTEPLDVANATKAFHNKASFFSPWNEESFSKLPTSKEASAATSAAAQRPKSPPRKAQQQPDKDKEAATTRQPSPKLGVPRKLGHRLSIAHGTFKPWPWQEGAGGEVSTIEENAPISLNLETLQKPGFDVVVG